LLGERQKGKRKKGGKSQKFNSDFKVERKRREGGQSCLSVRAREIKSRQTEVIHIKEKKKGGGMLI